MVKRMDETHAHAGQQATPLHPASPDGEPGWDLLTLGEPLACLTAVGGRLEATHELVKTIGGAELNTAIGLARLGLRTALVTRLGNDPFGVEILTTLRGEGVDTRFVTWSPDLPTGLMIKELRAPDDVRVWYYRRGSAAASLSAADVPPGAARRARRVHLTGITLALGKGPAAAVHALAQAAHAHGVPVSFDPNFRLKLWSREQAAAACLALLPWVDDLLMSEDEALALAGASDLDGVLAAVQRWAPSAVVIKRGDRGVVGLHGGQVVERPAHPVAHVVDTVGAGDAFNAGYLYARLSGLPFEQALDIGCWTASQVVAHLGDYHGFPRLAEYQAHAARARAVQR